MRKSRKETGMAVKVVILGIILLLYIFPFILVLINSLKEKTDIIRNPLSLIGDNGIVFTNFINAAEKMNFFNALANSLFVTVTSTLLIVLFSSMAAYIITRKNWIACRALFVLMILSGDTFSSADDTACGHLRRNISYFESSDDADLYAYRILCEYELFSVLWKYTGDDSVGIGRGCKY